jgi:hypothetical protein
MLKKTRYFRYINKQEKFDKMLGVKVKKMKKYDTIVNSRSQSIE